VKISVLIGELKKIIKIPGHRDNILLSEQLCKKQHITTFITNRWVDEYSGISSLRKGFGNLTTQHPATLSI
jgi:hypothetical protein